MRLYVADLATKQSVQLFSSTSLVEWPIGWHGSSLILADTVAHAQYAVDNPYDAYSGYQTVDSATGARLATICNFGELSFPIGPAVSAGTLCGYATASDWNGSQSLFAVPKGTECGAISPTGELAVCTAAYGGLDVVSDLLIYRHDGSHIPAGITGNRPAWTDEGHIVFSSGPNGSANASGEYTDILNLTDRSILRIDDPGEFVGVIPGGF